MTRFLSAAVPVMIFLALACRDLGLAGLNDGEAIFGVGALRVADALRSGHLGSMPSGIMLIHGIVQSWMALPFVAWMPLPPALALRSCFTVFGAGAVLLLYRLTLRALKSEAAAFVAALLLAASPAFIVNAHFGGFFNTTTVFFTAAALWSLCRWLEDGNARYFGLTAFFIGFSLGAVMHVIVLFGAFIVCMLYCLIFERRQRRAEALRCGGVFLLIGLAPLLWHLWDVAPDLWGGIVTRAGPDPWRFRDFLVITQRLRGLLDGTGLISVVEGLKPPVLYGSPATISYGNQLFPALFCGALAVLAYAGFRRPSGTPGEQRAALLARVLVVLNVSYWVFGSAVVRISDYYHFTSWQPIPQLTVAAALHWLVVSSGRRSKALSAAVLLLTFNAIADATVLATFFGYLRSTRGEDRWSPAVYDLSDWLKREDIHSAVALTFGLSYSLNYLSGGSFEVINAWEGHLEGNLKDDLRLSRPVYLLRHDRDQRLYIGDYKLERTLDYLSASNYDCAVRKDFTGARGEPVVSVLQCLPRRLAGRD